VKVERAGKGTWKFWCPGCNGAHMVSDAWQVNTDTATITPSVLVYSSKHLIDHDLVGEALTALENTTTSPRCHSFVTNGQIQFLGDSEHALAGQTVELQDWYEAFAGAQNLM
jgi:P2-related tail formation protein